MENRHSPKSSLKVLVTDDAAESRMLLVSLLQRLTRTHILEAKDGASALNLFEGHLPRLVFLDIDMPGMDGFAVLADINASGNEAFTVIVSGVSSLSNVERALNMGAGAFVVKPYSVMRIVEALRKFEEQAGEQILVASEVA